VARAPLISTALTKCEVSLKSKIASYFVLHRTAIRAFQRKFSTQSKNYLCNHDIYLEIYQSFQFYNFLKTYHSIKINMSFTKRSKSFTTAVVHCQIEQPEKNLIGSN